MVDQPRTLKSSLERQRRKQMLNLPHVAPLTNFARELRDSKVGAVPDFDPLDGGIQARALFLLEKPGPKAFESGFISRNNDDPTAENTFRFMQEAQISRQDVCIWNV